MIRRHPFAAVNLISDPIHGYVELTKRLAPDESAAAGLPDEDVAEEDLLDTAWLQRLRRISQLQSARWVFPTAEHSRFTHGLGVMHEAGLWARSLYPSLRRELLAAAGEPVPSEGLVVETLRMAGLLHDVGHGPFAHFFDDHVLAAFPAPADPRRAGGKRLTHEDLSQLIIEDELGPLIRGAAPRARRRPGARRLRRRRADRPGLGRVPRLQAGPADPSMPRWVRWLQPLLSGVFTVDNLDYVRRDAYLTGVAVGPVDVERLRRYAFISERGLTLYEPGLAALEMFLTARLFMYQQVYFHRTVRAIDLDLARGLRPSRSGRSSATGRRPSGSAAYADLDEYALLHQAARWARGEDVGGEADGPAAAGRRTGSPADGRRGLAGDPAAPAELARRGRGPRGVRGRRPSRPARSRRSGRPSRAASRSTWPIVDARPADAARGETPLLALERRDGSAGPSLAEALGRLPGYCPDRPPLPPSRLTGRQRPTSTASGAADRLAERPTPPPAACGRGGRTSSGSTRAISPGRQLHPLDDARDRSRSAAVSCGLNRP